jgi:DNA-binding MurR/RpiR family transcriptional regulator
VSVKGGITLSHVLDRIREREREMTESERVVARWLEANLNQLAFSPAGQIARQCGVSESTVVRFARKLGYESYPAMQRQMQSAVQQQLSLRQKLAKSRATTTSDQVLDRVFQTDIENLKQTLQMVSPSEFQLAVRRLAEADHVGVIGLRASAGPASYLAFTLNLVRPRVTQIVNSSGDLLDHLLDYGPRDLVVLISIAKAAKKTIEAAQYCVGRGIPTIGITDWQHAPLAPYCDLCLKVSATGVFWESYTGAVALANGLVTGVGLSLSVFAEARLKELEEANA